MGKRRRENPEGEGTGGLLRERRGGGRAVKPEGDGGKDDVVIGDGGLF